MKDRDITFRPELLLVPILLVSAALLVAGLRPDHDWGGDFAAYIMQAQSLAEGSVDAYLEDSERMPRSSARQIGPVAYPWGFPLLLAPVYACFGLEMVALKTPVVASYLLLLVALWVGFARSHAPGWRLPLVALFALNPLLLRFTDHVLSDIPFLLLSTVSLLLMGSSVVDRRPMLSPVGDRVLIGAAVALACTFRTVGLLLLPALAAAQLAGGWPSRRAAAPLDGTAGPRSPVPLLVGLRSGPGRHVLVAAIPYATCLLILWVVESVLPSGGGSYSRFLEEPGLSWLVRNVKYYLVVPSSFFHGAGHPVLVYGATLPLAIAGLIRRRRTDAHVLVFGLLTLATVVAWPERQGLRFVVPLLPFYVSFTLSGLEMAVRRSPAADARFRRVVAAAAVALVVLGFAATSATLAASSFATRRSSVTGPYQESAQQLFAFVRRRVPPDAVIAFFKPRVLRLYTGRTGFMTDRPELLAAADFLCFYLGEDAYDQITAEQLEAARSSGRLLPVYRNAAFEIYRVRERACGGASSATSDHPSVPPDSKPSTNGSS